MSEAALAGSSPDHRAPRPVLRVAHLIQSLGPGGAENILVELAQAARGADLELVVVELSPVFDPVHAGILRQLDVPVVKLGLTRWDPRAVPRTVEALRSHRIQLVHTHLTHADLVGAAAASWLGLPVVCAMRPTEQAPAGWVGRYLRTAGLVARRRLTARSIAVAHSQRDWYRRLVGSDDQLVVLPNGMVDPSSLPVASRVRLRAELGVGPDDPLVVSASLMRPEKGHDLLLDAVTLLAPELALTVALAGDGPLRTELQARVAGNPALADRVRFLGYRDDVPALLGAADLVLHTSRADALPTTLIHALAAGVPTVATSVGGIPDIVTAETGVLVPPRPQSIATAVETLLADGAARQRMGRAARARFLAQFEATGWADRLRAVYESVLADQPQPR